MELRFRLLLIIFLIGALHCQLGEMQAGNRQQGSKKYCGGQIGTALSAICKGNYNTLKRVDRFPRPTQWDAMYSDAPAPDSSELGYPFQSREEATSLMGGKRRKKRWGVYNECCEKSCTREELSSYCAASSDRKRR